MHNGIWIMEAGILPSLTNPIRSCKIASKNISGVKSNGDMEKTMLISLRWDKNTNHILHIYDLTASNYNKQETLI
jgi:hypothetical protein